MSPLSAGRRGLLFGLPVFLAAFLLFAAEPMTAKRILPWFGGSAAVWATCLVFYQTALLLGYAYAALLSKLNAHRVAVALHSVLVLLSLLLLPVGPSDRWANVDMQHPGRAVLSVLSASIGLPFFLLSATSPLVQHWAARAQVAFPYGLFALSNFASLCALLAYPTLVEPGLSLPQQSAAWSGLYVIWVVCILVAAWIVRRHAPAAVVPRETFTLPTRWLSWFTLSACGSVLLLAVTNHLTENVAAVPLLWVLPLAVYLLTFVLAFSDRGAFLKRSIWLRLLAFALGVLAYSVYDVNAIEAIQISLPVFLAGLFVCCFFCHRELYRLRPEASKLTSFYLAIAGGGAVGAICVGLVGPALFNGVYELPLGLLLTAVLASTILWEAGAWPERILWVGVSLCMVATLVANVRAYRENTLALRRSFYGSLRVVQSPRAGPEQTRTLFHGTIEHGSQYVQLPGRLRPTTYYGPDSGVGIGLREFPRSPKRVGLVGLGAGTLAAFGKPGDLFRFFELNSQVTDLAKSLFWYTRESRARIEIEQGDGRLLLAHEDGPPYDILVLDAFSGDAIPVHLLTVEAMQIYRRRLVPDGVLLVHVSNDFLDLAPVVDQLGRIAGWQSVLVRSHDDPAEGLLAADWMVLTNNSEMLANPAIRMRSQNVPLRTERPWTDSYNNLLAVMKTPQRHPSPSHSE